MFGKQKKSKHTSLIQIVSVLQKEKLGNSDYLDEIRLDLEENIPLSQKKLDFLKEGLGQLREKRKESKSRMSEISTINEKKDQKLQKHSEKKSLFGNLLRKKDKKESKVDLSVQNFDVKKQADKKHPTQKMQQNLIKPLDNSKNAQKQSSFFKFLDKKKPQKNDVTTQNDTQSLDDQKSDGKHFVEHDDIENKSILDVDELPRMHKPLEKTVRVNYDVILPNDVDFVRSKSVQSEGMKKFIDEINIETEILRTDVEEVKQLDDIKQLLTELSKEKEQLKSNVEEIKSRFNTKPLAEKYDEIERKLQSAADNLYSIQSNIYERIKEIRILRKDLSVIKEDLDSL